MKRISIAILFALYLTLLSGWLVLGSRADSTPSDNSQSYQSDYFTIQLPEELKATAYGLDDSQNVLVFENSDGTKGFQVFTLPYAGSLTPDALEQEIPDLFIIAPANTIIDTEYALSFYSQDPDIGETFEVWFVHNGLLYQVMTYDHLDIWLKGILTTWRFR